VKLLLDEHFSPKIASRLRRRQHDVLAARALPELHGLSDPDLLAFATNERRALVTENVADFAELHRAAITTGRRHYGLIVTSPRQFPRTARAIGRLVRALDSLLDNHPADDDLERQTWWLEASGD
jgi:predicted nuclease of predicted toxin-antitoxin system